MIKRLLALLCATTFLSAHNIYQYVEPIPFDDHGWFLNKAPLDQIFKQKRIRTVIELGSWAGKSALYFGKKVGPGGKVYCIDTWLGTATSKLHREDNRRHYLFQLFLSNVKHAGLEEVVVPYRMTTDEAARSLNLTADLIYVDGDHSAEQVFRDIVNWLPHLNEGGIICGDDWEYFPTVREGVRKAAEMYGYTIEATGNFWRFH